MTEYDYGREVGSNIRVDADDYNDLKDFEWYMSDRHGHIYGRSPEIGIRYLLHRLIAKRHNITGAAIVHKNGDPYDCRSCNLRGVTQGEALRLAKERRDDQYCPATD
jgi:hypothetical protein